MTADPVGFVPSSDKFTFGKNWLTISENTTSPELMALVERLALLHRSSQLWLGDAIRYGERKGFYTDSKVYDELEAVTGLKRGTLQQYKSVAEKTSCTRVQDLDYAHHREVAALPHEEQRVLLEKALAEKWTIHQLRCEIRRLSTPTAVDEMRVVRDVNRRLEDEREGFEGEVAELLERINKLPRPYRMKIKKGIKGRD